jgi:hypothetical protein
MRAGRLQHEPTSNNIQHGSMVEHMDTIPVNETCMVFSLHMARACANEQLHLEQCTTPKSSICLVVLWALSQGQVMVHGLASRECLLME